MRRRGSDTGRSRELRGLLASWRTALRRAWRDYQWYCIAALWVLALALGMVGFGRYYSAAERAHSGWDIVYSTLQLFVLEFGNVSGPLNWQLEAARILAPLVTVFTVIQAMAALFYEELQRTRARLFADHVVVCGLGRKGLLIAGEFRRRGYRVVVIERDGDNPRVGQCRELGAVVIPGDAADTSTLRKARAHRAAYLVSVCGGDGTNAEVAVHAHALAGGRKGRALHCVAHIADPALCDLVRERELFLGQAGDFRLDFFNVFDAGSRALLAEFPPFTPRGEGVAPERPHLLVVGLGNLGESLVLHAARTWHPHYRSSGRRLLVSVVDRVAEEKVESLCLRHPQLRKTCLFRALQMEVESSAFRRADFLFDPGGDGVTSVYVCLDNDSRGLYAALTLVRCLGNGEIPVVVRMAHRAGLATLVEGGGGDMARFSNLHTFPLLDRTCKPEFLLAGVGELLARAIHEEYLRNQAKRGFTSETNPSMVPWEALPEDLKESNRSQADHVGSKLRAVGCDIRPLEDWDAEPFTFSPGEVELMARMEHERWMEERLADGWTYHPGKKDLERKTSPHLVPWEELPEDVRDYDRETVRAMPAFLKEAGFQVYRLRGGSG
ncbi:MAG: NAD-binding protein [Actinobacteria bacterium]|nr:NAD-binding protein [Actinomycetota bacterium]